MARRVRRLATVLAVGAAGMAAAGLWLGPFLWRIERAGPGPGAAFRWPYYLYLPASAERRARGGRSIHLLVCPNNTGKPDDDPGVHSREALLRAFRMRGLAEDLEVAALVPAFPRPAAHWRVYTHALDRDSLTTRIEGIERLDLQLLAMIDDVVDRLAARGVRAERRVLITGFSANGMFANRFALLHPDRVLAAAVGSPGGWPIAPVPEWEGTALRYPVGVGDLAKVAGLAIDLPRFRAVPLFFFQGEEDRNDSVAFDDGYDAEDRETVRRLFGDDLAERFRAAERIYASVASDARFRLYPGAGHGRTREMDADVRRFFAEALAAAGG